MERPDPTRLARGSIFFVCLVLSFALAINLGGIIFGRFTADAYYLPLRAVPLGDRQQEVERIVIATCERNGRYQNGLWLAIHALALGGALLARAAVERLDA